MRLPTVLANRFVCLAALAAIAGGATLARGEELRVAIYVMKPSGDELRKVVQLPGYREHSAPAWSHDGKRLAFDATEAATLKRKIIVVNVDGGDAHPIAEGAFPDWSPDDKQIVYRRDGADGGITVQNLNGNGRTVIAQGDGPRWSADGGKLLVTDRHALRVLDLVSGEERGRIDVPVQEVNAGGDWSPDGKRLAAVIRRGRERELVLVTAEGPIEIKSRLTRNIDGRVSWSHDGKRIVISSGRRLYLLDPDAKSTQIIPGQRGVSVEPCWSPDDKWLAFAGNHPPVEEQPTEAK